MSGNLAFISTLEGQIGSEPVRVLVVGEGNRKGFDLLIVVYIFICCFIVIATGNSAPFYCHRNHGGPFSSVCDRMCGHVGSTAACCDRYECLLFLGILIDGCIHGFYTCMDLQANRKFHADTTLAQLYVFLSPINSLLT